MNVATSDVEPTAPAARTPAEVQRPTGQINAKSIAAILAPRPADSRSGNVEHLDVSTTTLSTAPLPGAGELPAGAPVDTAKKGIAVRTSVAVQQAMQAVTGRSAPLRMHVEWNGDAAAVWVGVDPTGEAALPGLISCLAETLSRSGLRLRSVVCNGSRCFQAGATAADGKPRFKPVDIFMESES